MFATYTVIILFLYNKFNMLSFNKSTLLIGFIFLIVLVRRKLISCSERFSRLSFIHIPKTAGTTIEELGSRQGILWGRYHLENDVALTQSKTKDVYYNWHVPPRFCGQHNPYKNSATFCVVRDPVSRIVSEYKWFHADDHSKDNPTDMNTWLDNMLTENNVYVTGGIDGHGHKHGHLFPQHFYVYNTSGKKTCDHVLLMDDLTHQFNRLMKQYGIDTVRMTDDTRYNDSDFTVSESDIDPSNLSKIRELYKEDFKLYRMLQQKKEVENF